jgi:hypothetical protein
MTATTKSLNGFFVTSRGVRLQTPPIYAAPTTTPESITKDNATMDSGISLHSSNASLLSQPQQGVGRLKVDEATDWYEWEEAAEQLPPRPQRRNTISSSQEVIHPRVQQVLIQHHNDHHHQHNNNNSRNNNNAHNSNVLETIPLQPLPWMMQIDLPIEPLCPLPLPEISMRTLIQSPTFQMKEEAMEEEPERRRRRKDSYTPGTPNSITIMESNNLLDHNPNRTPSVHSLPDSLNLGFNHPLKRSTMAPPHLVGDDSSTIPSGAIRPLLRLSNPKTPIPTLYPPFQHLTATQCPMLDNSILLNPDVIQIPLCSPLCLLPVVNVTLLANPQHLQL